MNGTLGAFFKQFLPEFLSKMEDLDSNQREKLQATFNEEIVSINCWITSKGVFFSESEICFSNLQKKYSKSLSWAWNLNKLFTVMSGNFKFQVQDSDLEIWKTNLNSEKKPALQFDDFLMIFFLYISGWCSKNNRQFKVGRNQDLGFDRWQTGNGCKHRLFVPTFGLWSRRGTFYCRWDFLWRSSKTTSSTSDQN